nr:immunoglobulin heavy chain junction region [Macaca mulatta]MOX03070.1 immunoglobulin heavy chain junction region [Macaca mulatta]MOX03841.1 immunoglobulin heavy chain junction region [Macaca mulatta]
CARDLFGIGYYGWFFALW